MSDTVQAPITFVGGPLGGQQRAYDLPLPAQIEQPYAIESNPNVAEVHIYKVVKLYRVANWAGMVLRPRGSRKVYNLDIDFAPDRDTLDDVLLPEHERTMTMFLADYQRLLELYGVDVDYDSCYECGGEARFVIGRVMRPVVGRETT